ncbi:DUF4832 domain-containing protein [Thermus sp. SYSU G05001]|uniref:DUF4832 domain-containing protein n=1 Tax=Thermus brevis TaxID=2862456 RepID=A0ABS7A2C0_9DEIN|nr:DUF4832 domain-containing protein [Thermus brevis]
MERDQGYRFYLWRVEVSSNQLRVGEAFTLRFCLGNQGFGGFCNPKGLEVVFKREGGWPRGGAWVDGVFVGSILGRRGGVHGAGFHGAGGLGSFG